MTTITINVEIFDNTSVNKIEQIIGEALNDNGIDCYYEIKETSSDIRKGE